MKFFIDENIAPQIAKALTILQQPLNNGEAVEIRNIKDEYGQGADDEEWIPEVGKVKGIVLTQDSNIYRTRQQRQLYEHHNVGVIFLKPPSKTGYRYWDLVRKIVDMWPEIKKVSRKSQRPFAYRTTPRKNRLEPM